MKTILTVLFLGFGRSVFSQTTIPVSSWESTKRHEAYKCTAKLDEWARWRETETLIEVSNDKIVVKEIDGVELHLKYDKAITNQNGVQFFMYDEATRMTVSLPIITVFENHYKCELQL